MMSIRSQFASQCEPSMPYRSLVVLRSQYRSAPQVYRHVVRLGDHVATCSGENRAPVLWWAIAPPGHVMVRTHQQQMSFVDRSLFDTVQADDRHRHSQRLGHFFKCPDINAAEDDESKPRSQSLV